VLLTLLGLPEDTDDADLVIETVRDAILPPPTGDDTAPSAVAAAAKRHRLEAIDVDTKTSLERDSAELRRVKAAAKQADIEAKVDAAVDRGAIIPSRKKHLGAATRRRPAHARRAGVHPQRNGNRIV
jgi:hypothetical protein